MGEENQQPSGQAETKKCPKCAETVQKDAVVCKHCGSKIVSSGRKKVGIGCLIILLIIIALIMIGSNSGNNSGSDNSNKQSKETKSDNTSNNSQKVGKVGETISDGDLGFTISAIKNATSLGSTYTKKTAQGTFYVLNVKIQNNSNSTKTINASDFSMIDSQGRKYEYSTEGQMALTLSQDGTDLFLKQVQPSLSITGSIVFDVPKEATGLKLVAQGGLFSDKVTIDLGK